jgi:ATP/maltotriose-dependent transcriptional regulator MalT
MRVVLVGSASDRARLRAQLNDAVEVVGEYETLSRARAAGHDADATIIAEGGRAARPAMRSGRSWSALHGGDDEDGAFDEPLTAREVQVLELLAEGLPNKTIAQRLGISDQTVKFHVSSISGKLGAANRTDAVRRAVRRGLITL